MWAILSGIEGNLQAYEAVVADLQRQRFPIEELYILGDFIGLNRDSELVVERLKYPLPGELEPQICLGWWEEQCLILHGLSSTKEPTELIAKYGGDRLKLLWESISRQTIQWLRSLDFGFIENDSFFVHASSVSVTDELNPDTSPWAILDRLQRVGVNHLFCGRSGLMFEYILEESEIASSVMTLDEQQPTEMLLSIPKRLVGVGNVGKELGKASYTLYDPRTELVEFKIVNYS
jgi:diadenosine tetraphosphatase ApaH/serine/threonine PP2A family protein phosphatase